MLSSEIKVIMGIRVCFDTCSVFYTTRVSAVTIILTIKIW